MREATPKSSKVVSFWHGLEALEPRILLHGLLPDDPDHHDIFDPQDASQIRSNVQKLSQVTLSNIPGRSHSANDLWGYVSPSGREYAVLGIARGIAFVEVTEPRYPKVVAFVPGLDDQVDDRPCKLCLRDMKVYDQYAYVTNERFSSGEFVLSGGGGVQIIDLTQIDQGAVVEIGTLTQDGLDTAHNIAVNLESGFAYVTGANIANGGLVAIDLATDPTNPRIVGTWSELYIHDAEVVSYNDGPFAGREIVFGFAGLEGIKIIDVTDKANIFTMATETYPNITYAHYGALSEDRNYLFVNDELDELFNDDVTMTTTYVLDVQDLGNPQFVTSFSNGLPASDHNLRIRGDLLFEANYRSGLRIFDVSDVHQVHEVGFYDTYPRDDDAHTNGAWGVYADLPSGIVLVSDTESGLLVLDPTDDSSEIRGMQWDDADGDGEIGASEIGLGGWTLYLDLNENGQLDSTGYATLTFQQGVDGYAATRDTFFQEFSNIPNGAEPSVQINGFTRTEGRNGLLQFGELFGTGPNKIPFGSTITSANLTIVADDSASTGPTTVHRMYLPWDEDDTAMEWANGTSPNGKTAASTADATISAPISIGSVTIDVTQSLQVWSNGVENQGWLFHAPSSDGWSFHSSDESQIALRPQLSVTFLYDEPVEVTNDVGEYHFEGLAPDTYTVAQLSQSGWVQTAPDSNGDTHSVNLITNRIVGQISFGNRQPIVGRHVFYNNSAFDGNDPAPGTEDDQAIAPSPTTASSGILGKAALLPGQTATFANYTSYSRGINGIMVDILDLAEPTHITSDDFAFRVGNDDTPSGWNRAPDPAAVAVREGDGRSGSDRVTIVWEDNAIGQTWLQVMVKATANTGLSEPDVHYWGNAIGDTGDQSSQTYVNSTDQLNARFHSHQFLNPAPIDDFVDFDRDSRVNATDELIARFHGTNFLSALELITVLETETQAIASSSGIEDLNAFTSSRLAISVLALAPPVSSGLDSHGKPHTRLASRVPTSWRAETAVGHFIEPRHIRRYGWPTDDRIDDFLRPEARLDSLRFV